MPGAPGGERREPREQQRGAQLRSEREGHCHDAGDRGESRSRGHRFGPRRDGDQELHVHEEVVLHRARVQQGDGHRCGERHRRRDVQAAPPPALHDGARRENEEEIREGGDPDDVRVPAFEDERVRQEELVGRRPRGEANVARGEDRAAVVRGEQRGFREMIRERVVSAGRQDRASPQNEAGPRDERAPSAAQIAISASARAARPPNAPSRPSLGPTGALHPTGRAAAAPERIAAGTKTRPSARHQLKATQRPRPKSCALQARWSGPLLVVPSPAGEPNVRGPPGESEAGDGWARQRRHRAIGDSTPAQSIPLRTALVPAFEQGLRVGRMRLERRGNALHVVVDHLPDVGVPRDHRDLDPAILLVRLRRLGYVDGAILSKALAVKYLPYDSGERLVGLEEIVELRRSPASRRGPS